MELTGTKELKASPAEVYAALNNSEILSKCVPGCEELEQTSDTEFKAKVKLKIGPISTSFAGDIELSDLNPPHSYTISGKGSGGAAGHASGSAKVVLSEHNGGTKLDYEAKAAVVGKIAQLGSRLIDATAKSLADKFFTNLVTQLDPQPTADEATQADASASASSATWGLAPKHWTILAAAGLIIIVALGLLH